MLFVPFRLLSTVLLLGQALAAAKAEGGPHCLRFLTWTRLYALKGKTLLRIIPAGLHALE